MSDVVVVSSQRCYSLPTVFAENLADARRSQRLARLGADTLAIDASEENVQTAALHASQDPQLLSMLEAGHLEYRASAVEHLPGARADAQSQDQFDVVCAMEVLEHVEDPPGFLRSLANLTKVGYTILKIGL
jgi:2-polyprenyl-6-hydroxyphenyl methylase/3-demethylubiquinone-9 3-methyltransferase